LKTNIILTGMPGAGKSTVGVILAKTLGMDFVDVDIRIARTQGMPLQTLLDTCGIDAFLKAEEQEALALDVSDTVIATGGSMVLSEAAMTHLMKNGVNVYLAVPLRILAERLINIKTRGVVAKPGETLADVWAARKPLYKKYAQITVNCGDLTTEEIVAEICLKYQKEIKKMSRRR